MSQIFGLCGIHDAGQLQHAMSQMATVIRRVYQPDPVVWLDPTPGVGLGCIPDDPPHRLEVLPSSGATAAQPSVLDGVLYRGPVAGDTSPEVAILEQYRERGSALLDDLDGSFCLALYLDDRRQLVVANDRFSTRALYWTEHRGRFMFSSEMKALLAVPGVPTDLDRSALAQSAGFSRILDHRTLVRNIWRLPGATMLEWSEGSGVRIRRYWHIESQVSERQPMTSERQDNLIDAFRNSVKVRATRAAPLGISLSGGLDSRAIAAVLAAESIPAVSCTTGFPGSADQRLAAQVAAVAGTDHHFFELRKDAIAEYPTALRAAAFVRDEPLLFGGFPGRLQETFCATFGIRTLLRGHGGENVKLAEAWPFQITPAVLSMNRAAELRPHLRRVLASCPEDADLDGLLPEDGAPPVATLLDAAIDTAIAAHAPLMPAEIMSALYLVQNDGMEVPLTRNGLRGRAEMALPFLDYRVLDVALATRVQDRLHAGTHVAIMRRLAPGLLRIGNSNTGAPVDASRFRVLVTDKVNTLLKRLKVPGFRHYHYMEHWLQGFLAEQVRAIVLDERTLARGVFPRGALIALMERARGDSGMSRLVNFVMNVEIWCRLFMDGEVIDDRTSV
jgi:asparagine synthase (glutamine-hydrolysing)